MTSPPTQPEINAAFATEGHFVALPLGVANETLPLAADESWISTLAASCDGQRIYGATRGAACHVFASVHKGACGAVLDLGILPGVEKIAAICERKFVQTREMTYWLAMICETGDALVVEGVRYALASNTIQEPFFSSPETRRLDSLASWGGVVGATVLGDTLHCLAKQGLALVSLETGRFQRAVEVAGSPPVSPPLATEDGAVVWLAADGGLRRFVDGAVHDYGSAEAPGPVACACLQRDHIVVATVAGELLRWDVKNGQCTRLAQAFPLPVQCLTALPNGELYGICGAEIGHLFRVEADGAFVDLGVVASVIGAIRHGFAFSSALTTCEGVVYLGEYDRGGHLWMYFPPWRGPDLAFRRK